MKKTILLGRGKTIQEVPADDWLKAHDEIDMSERLAFMTPEHHRVPRAQPGADGFAKVALVNESLDNGRGLGVYIRFRPDQLPHFLEWKMLGEGTYVVGMEPGNCTNAGRAATRKAGELVFLQPQEKREYNVEIGVQSAE